MRKLSEIKSSLFAALVTLCALVGAQAGTFTTDFNSGLPAGSAVYDSAIISPNDGTGGGFTNSGCLQLVNETTAQTGLFVITNDFDAGQPVVSFTATFKVLIGSLGNGADGFSFNFASDLDLSGATTGSEEGFGTGLTVSFDTYPNGAPDTAQSIDVKVGGTQISSTSFPGLRTGTFVDAVIQLNPNGTLNVVYDGVYAVSNLDVSALGSIAGGGFGFGARDGSVTDNHFIDDLTIVTQTNASPFVQSFAPRGGKAATNSAIDIVLTDSTSQVNPASIALKLDGATITPTVTKVGADTILHFVPATPFAPLSLHSVSLVYADNASPTPNLSNLKYSFTAEPSFAIIFVDGFESRGRGPLDMNTAGPNAGANGDLAGNPWFGPAPPNAQVVGNPGTVVPHSGTNMIRGSAPSDFDENWINLPYRFNGGVAYSGNVLLDWWFYDPLGAGGSTYRDYVAIGWYNTEPFDTDYPGTGSLNSSGQIQRLSLGASSVVSAGYDSTKYQARVVNANEGYASGWFNTPTIRSVGWHHGRIIVGPALVNSAPRVDFYIDDMINPTFSHNAILRYGGYNVIELNTAYGATFGYMDDISFGVVVTPKITVSQSGNNINLAWPGSFTLQSATDVSGPYTDVAGATSPYSFDSTTSPRQFFRLRN